MHNHVYSILLSRKKLTDIAFILSSLALTFVLTINFSIFIPYDGYIGTYYFVKLKYVAAAVFIMTPVYYCFLQKTNIVQTAIVQSSRLSFIISASLTVAMTMQLVLDCRKNLPNIIAAFTVHFRNTFLEQIGYKLFMMILCAASCFGAFVFILYTCNALIRFFSQFISEADCFEKRYFIVAFISCLFLICVFFSRTYAPWGSLDIVYQTDTIFVTEHYYPVFSYGYDFDWDIGCGGIRHPLATMLTYPVYVVVGIVSNFLYFIPNYQPFLYAVFHSILLIISAIALKRITHSPWASIIYSLSFPFIFFVVFIEKYQLSVFLMIMFVYAVMRKESNGTQKYFLIASSGMMLTSAVYGFFYGKEKTLWARIKEYIGVGLSFLAVLVATGRIHYIINFSYLSSQNFSTFVDGGNAINTLFNKIAGFTNLIASAFIPIAYEATEQNFYWKDLTNLPNWVGIIICVFLVISIIANRKKKVVWLLAFWLLWAAFQEIALGIGVGCDPLFSLYFTWPVIALTVMGINALIKNKRMRYAIYAGMMLVMLFLNAEHLNDLLDYLKIKAPI